MKVSRQSIADFYKIHQEKGKAYTYNNFKTSGYSKAGIYKIMSKFDEMGNVCQNIQKSTGQNQFCQSEWAWQSPDEVKTCNLC